MEVERVAPALRERLGVQGTAGLVSLLEAAQQDWTADVTTAAERFERRLTDETAGLRVALAHTEGILRQEIAGLRTEMHNFGAALRQEHFAGRFELLKWSFAFWIGQVIAVTGIVGLMLRVTRP